MDFDRLTEFVIIAKYENIRQAAAELGVSSATLSARLRNFEDHLGVTLFHRGDGRLQLTEEGQRLLPNANEILGIYRKTLREIHTVSSHNYHRLSIAITGSSLPLHLGPFLDQLNLTYPGIRLDILDDSKYGILEGLQSGAADLYFAPVMEDFAPKELVKVPVASASQYIILPKSHRLADRTMVSMQELDWEQFILYPKTAEPAIRTFQTRNLRASGIHYTLYESDTSVVFNKLLIPIGKGILLQPTHMMDLPPNTVCLPLTGIAHPAPICFFYSKANTNPDVLAFAKDYAAFAKEVSHDHYPAL